LIRLYVLCASVEWNHLPVAGGLWDQDPRFIQTIWVVNEERAKYEAEKERREKHNKLGQHNVVAPPG